VYPAEFVLADGGPRWRRPAVGGGSNGRAAMAAALTTVSAQDDKLAGSPGHHRAATAGVCSNDTKNNLPRLCLHSATGNSRWCAMDPAWPAERHSYTDAAAVKVRVKMYTIHLSTSLQLARCRPDRTHRGRACVPDWR